MATRTTRTHYGFNNLAGCVVQRRSRSTGHLVGLYHGEQAGMDTDDGRSPWTTVCEEHGHAVCHDTLARAREHLADPGGWCEECGAEEDAREAVDAAATRGE